MTNEIANNIIDILAKILPMRISYIIIIRIAINYIGNYEINRADAKGGCQIRHGQNAFGMMWQHGE